MRQHAVHARQGFVDVLEEQDAVARIDGVARAGQGRSCASMGPWKVTKPA
ncbi:Uncharacterised protein [Bordetella pertussis]|nr:Uncharacterised protein [Bordetella pertussis]